MSDGIREAIDELSAVVIEQIQLDFLRSPQFETALAEALRAWRGKVFINPSDPDAWYAESARAIAVALLAEIGGTLAGHKPDAEARDAAR